MYYFCTIKLQRKLYRLYKQSKIKHEQKRQYAIQLEGEPESAPEPAPGRLHQDTGRRVRGNGNDGQQCLAVQDTSVRHHRGCNPLGGEEHGDRYEVG